MCYWHNFKNYMYWCFYCCIGPNTYQEDEEETYIVPNKGKSYSVMSFSFPYHRHYTSTIIRQ